MKVIILKTNEIKEVSFGYAVNYLFPKGLAVLATDEKIELIKHKQLEDKAKKTQQQLEDQMMAQRLAGKEITIKAKVGKGKKLFGSITKKEIIQALGVEGKRVEVILTEPIKKLGEHKIELKIGVERVTIKVEVISKL